MLQVFTEEDFKKIYGFMRPIWQDTYGGFLSSQQIDFLLDKYFSEAGLAYYRNSGYEYFKIGDAGVLVIVEREKEIYLDKLYLLPHARGKGYPEKIFAFLAQRNKDVVLNVNQNNERAVNCYRKNGFAVEQTIDIHLGNGMVNRDFIMRKKI